MISGLQPTFLGRKKSVGDELQRGVPQTSGKIWRLHLDFARLAPSTPTWLRTKVLLELEEMTVRERKEKSLDDYATLQHLVRLLYFSSPSSPTCCSSHASRRFKVTIKGRKVPGAETKR